MNLSTNLMILLVLFIGFKYSICDDPKQLTDCLMSNNQSIQLGQAVVCKKAVTSKKTYNKDQRCCAALDSACAVVNAANTVCKGMPGLDEYSKRQIKTITDLICKKSNPTPNLCQTILPPNDSKDCSGLPFSCSSEQLGVSTEQTQDHWYSTNRT